MVLDDPFAHFVLEGDGAYVGKHSIMELWGVRNHTDEASIKECFMLACQHIGATVLFTHVHPFGLDYGTTGVVVLAESHLSWHHYPECAYLAVDIFVCGNLDPTEGFQIIHDFWRPASFDVQILKRGKIPCRETFIKQKP